MSGVFENDDNNLSDDSLASDDERIINKKLSADVWEFFQKIQDEESWLITNYKCILCAKLYSPDSLVDFVATDLQPFTIVENPEFKLLINKLNPHYILPCRQTLKEKFIENYKMRKNVLINEVSQINSKISLTTDIWTSEISKDCYLGVTMHYINNNWELKNLLLDLIPVNGSHTAGLITSKLLQILEEFSISNNILALTTDNGSNMIACGNQLATELDQEFNNMAFTHYRCAAHIINLAVKAGMSHVGNEIKKLRQFVVKIKNSPLFLDKLSEICTLKKVKFLKPILDIDIRWNSTYFMINRQILMQGVSELLATTNVEELGDLFPTISEWRHIKELAKVLEPMYEATNLLSSSKNPTQGDIRLVFNGMFKKLDHYQRGNHHTQKAIASAICNKLKAYWDKYLNQSSITSSILDSRYKTTLFSHNDITEIISKLQELYLSYLPLNNQTIPSAPARSSRDYFLNLLNPNNIRQEVSYDELDRYLNSPVDSNTGSLIWWKTYEKDYPVLSQIAKDYLTIQATSVPSERAFSISGLTISKTRNRLDPETARAIICMKNWISEKERMEN
ncbi:zinc finger BED domain-containing protein RICESLEEPER 2-like [Rhizophagus irregularis DAOM 181602=DAOM 197198]|nr:zinc finger BED domain-containing protein RICESLEEPER 2-like [Rhizophagus irregularis DAOM 181602=DAOM 197198]